MKNLRAQFILLIAGILLVPALTLAGVISFSKIYSGDDISNMELLISIMKEINRTDILEDLPLPARYEDEFYERRGRILITDQSGETILSLGSHYKGFRELTEEEGFADSEIFRIHINHRQTDYTLALLIDPVEPENRRQKPFLFSEIKFIPLILMILFVIAFSLHIIRSIDSRILEMERATREIAGGNLDYRVPVPGTDKFASLARSLDRMRQQLKSDEEYRARFITSISHDLKTPLTTIDGYLDALIDGFGNDRERQQKFYEIMKEKSLILTERIARLIGFAKMTTGEWETHKKPVLAGIFFKDFLDSYRLESELRGYSLESPPLPPLDVYLSMDENLVHRALENLIQNAVKYSDVRKRIVFRVERRDQCILVRVGNYGRGILPENHESVFTPFFRESQGRNEAGSGLGLSSVKYIMEAHRWKIDLNSHPGEYTEFIISIPLQADHRPDVPQDDSPAL